MTESLLRPTPSLRLMDRVTRRVFSSKGSVHEVKGNKHESFAGGACLHQLSQVSSGISLLIHAVHLDLAGPRWQSSSFQLFPSNFSTATALDIMLLLCFSAGWLLVNFLQIPARGSISCLPATDLVLKAIIQNDMHCMYVSKSWNHSQTN